MPNWFFGQNLLVEKGKSEQHHWVLNTRMTILLFMDHICSKRVFPVYKRNWILDIWINLGPKFQLKLTILIFWTNLRKRVFSIENRKSELHLWSGNFDFLDKIFAFLVENKKVNIIIEILHIRISLGIKFHFKQTISNIGTKFAQKGYFQSKTEKVNITIEVYIQISLGTKF